MLYRVKAQPISQEMPKFQAILTDGTVAKQEPDGQEITASMKRAVITGDTVEWYETCYCSPPLKHERATVYDRFFTEMRIEPVDSPPILKGERFWNYLQSQGKEEKARYTSRANLFSVRIY